MRRAEIGFLRAFALFELGDFARARGDVEIAGHAADFLARTTLGAGEIAEDLHQLRIVVRLHLVGQELVAVDRVDLDLIGDGQEIVEIGDFRGARGLAHSSKSFSSSDKSTLVAPAAG